MAPRVALAGGIESDHAMDRTREAQLVQHVMDGDRAALGDLLEKYKDRLYNVVLRMVGSRDEAVDVAGQAMLNIIQGIDSYRGPAAISTWMIRIAMNTSISHLRKRRLRQVISLDGSDRSDHEDQSTPLREQLANQREPAPDQNVQDREMVGLLQAAIGRLEEQFRSVLVLTDIDEMDYQQIAMVLSVPVGTVKSRLFRARLSLRHAMLKLVKRQQAPAAQREGLA